jgi:homoserine kinase
MSENKVRVRVPASTANLGPGFDTIGMALDLYAWIEMSFAAETSIRLYGNQMENIPVDKSNLVYKVAQQVFQEAGMEHQELEISMYSDIPLTRGLGSSASAIVGGMVAANALIGGNLTNDRIFEMASGLEKHPDNVGAALFGGIVVAFWDGEKAEYVKIEPHERLEVLVAIPDYQLETEKARNVLPASVSMKDAVFNVSHSSVLVAALCTRDFGKIRQAMKDVLHQPYRAPLIPGMESILEKAADYGALGAALSGAGPTLLCLVDSTSDRKKELECFLQDTFRQNGIAAETMWLKPYGNGTQVLTQFDRNSTLIENIRGEVRA